MYGWRAHADLYGVLNYNSQKLCLLFPCFAWFTFHITYWRSCIVNNFFKGVKQFSINRKYLYSLHRDRLVVFCNSYFFSIFVLMQDNDRYYDEKSLFSLYQNSKINLMRNKRQTHYFVLYI